MKARLLLQRTNPQTLLDLLLQATSRPSSRCLYRHPFPSKELRFKASRTVGRCFSTTTLYRDAVPSPAPPKKSEPVIPPQVGLDRNPQSLSAVSRLPIPTGARNELFTPGKLARPLGLPYPPQPGQNAPIDHRTLAEKSRDFSSKEQALQRRKKLLRTYLRPYFQEWKTTEHWQGKSFVANERLFKKDTALYFPNMWGTTLSKEGDGPDGGRDTTPAFQGKITLVGIQSGQWAERQVDSFLSSTQNPELQSMIAEGMVQRADINVQDNWLRALLVFTSILRKQTPLDRWERYFRVRMSRDVGRGLTEDIRDAMGFLNGQVGYVYLLDPDCRIRWAASGNAWPGEKDCLNAGIRRLHAEMMGRPVRKEDAMPTKITQPTDEIGSPRAVKNLLKKGVKMD